MTADAYSGNKTGRKNLSLVLEFFKSSLEGHLLLFGFAWLVVVTTTFMAWVVPHPEDFVQKWWFYGSVHLAFLQALVLTFFAKGLAQAGNGRWVPGWRRAHDQALLAWLFFLVLIPFLAGVAWSWLAAESWDAALLPWLLFAVCTASMVAYLSPLKEASWQLIYLLFVGVLIFEGAFYATDYPNKFVEVSPAWLPLGNVIWLLAIGAGVMAFGMYRGSSLIHTDSFKLNRWSYIKNACSIAVKVPQRWLEGRRWPLLEHVAVSKSQRLIQFVTFTLAASSIKGDVTLQIMFFWLVCVAGTSESLLNTKFGRQASVLMWLPTGLSRYSLGKDLFLVVLRRNLLFVFTLALAFIGYWIAASHPALFVVRVANLLLVLGYCVFSAGWAVAFHRHKVNKIIKVIVLIFPVAAVSIALAIAMARGLRGSPHLISDQTQLTLAVLFALTGWYLGHLHTAHWGQQEFEGLLKPAKRLA